MKMDDLRELVEKELADESFSTRTHGRSSTYRDGCRGPLCMRANRSRHRRLRSGDEDDYGYQGILDKMLEPFQADHDRVRGELTQLKGA